MIINIIYDSINGFKCPSKRERDDQINSTDLDNLAEFSGRECYDSLWKKSSRNSINYFKHINETKDFSIYQHSNITIKFIDLSYADVLEYVLVFSDRPGVRLTFQPNWREQNNKWLKITINARSAIEWFNFPKNSALNYSIGQTIRSIFKEKMPLVFSDTISELDQKNLVDYEIATPVEDHEIWVTFQILKVSRNLTLELVRHSYGTAVSQRSSRYVNEAESDIAHHPYCNKYGISDTDEVKNLIDASRNIYRSAASLIEKNLLEDGKDKSFAKKQSLGAARSYLPSALSTNIIFSSSLEGWKWIIKSRLSERADLEINILAGLIFEDLNNLYPTHFNRKE